MGGLAYYRCVAQWVESFYFVIFNKSGKQIIQANKTATANKEKEK